MTNMEMGAASVPMMLPSAVHAIARRARVIPPVGALMALAIVALGVTIAAT